MELASEHSNSSKPVRNHEHSFIASLLGVRVSSQGCSKPASIRPACRDTAGVAGACVVNSSNRSDTGVEVVAVSFSWAGLWGDADPLTADLGLDWVGKK